MMEETIAMIDEIEEEVEEEETVEEVEEEEAMGGREAGREAAAAEQEMGVGEDNHPQPVRDAPITSLRCCEDDDFIQKSQH
jgi:hypothetical protein